MLPEGPAGGKRGRRGPGSDAQERQPAGRCPEPTAADVAAEAAEFDALVKEQVASGEAAPARGWLSDSDNMLFEGDPQARSAR
jgi:hypothetical protein